MRVILGGYLKAPPAVKVVIVIYYSTVYTQWHSKVWNQVVRWISHWVLSFLLRHIFRWVSWVQCTYLKALISYKGGFLCCSRRDRRLSNLLFYHWYTNNLLEKITRFQSARILSKEGWYTVYFSIIYNQ